MQLTYKTANGRISVTLEGDTQKDVWEELAAFQEVFENTVCSARVDVDGKKVVVSSDNVVFRVRVVEDNPYYELVCVEPGPLYGYKKSFGQNKKGGGLFPKSPEKDDPNVVLGFQGWHKYLGKGQPQQETKTDNKKTVPFE